MARAIDSKLGRQGMLLGNLDEITQIQGNDKEAMRQFETAIAILREVGDKKQRLF